MSANANLITVKELIDELHGRTLIVPLLQRNYKWPVKSSKSNSTSAEDRSLNSNLASAEKLLNDVLYNCDKNIEHTIGLLTFYEYKSDIQVIDGQQRLITLSLIVKALGHYNTNDFLSIVFGRDNENEYRKKYLEESVESISTDVQHMKAVMNRVNEILLERKINNDEQKNKIFDYILNNIKMLIRYSDNEPLQEYLNLNEKKTRFTSTDYDRAYQIKHQSCIEGKKDDMISKIIEEHSLIQRYLYTKDQIYNLIKHGYSELPNRMDYLFEKIKKAEGVDNLAVYYERIDADNNKDEKYEICYKYLIYCKKVLRSISQELEERDNSKLNVNVVNSIYMLYNQDKEMRFFDLIDINDLSNKTFEEIVKEKFNLYEETYNYMKMKNCFMESVLYSDINKNESEENESSVRIYQESIKFANSELLAFFDSRFKTTIEMIEKGKNYGGGEGNNDQSTISETQDNESYMDVNELENGKKSFKDFLNIDISKVKRIIVPAIQRDYTLGSDYKGLSDLLFDISKSYISNCIGYKEDEYEEGSAARIVAHHLNQGKFWKQWETKLYYKEDFEQDEIKNLFNNAGISIYDKGYDWRGNERKNWIINCIKEWNNRLKIENTDFDKVKNRNYFNAKEYANNFMLSNILGYKEGKFFYIYDGQQRIVTLVYLVAFILNQMNDDLSNENYKELLSKFKFQNRKEANDLLEKLLNSSEKVIIKDLEKEFVVDHTTYSIIELLKTYDSYKNDYDNDILSFSVEYIMNNIMFEFVSIGEQSIANQMYMDLNSKNIPLSPYENYKAELVYILSTKFSNEYEKYWKYELDNEYLDKCYKFINVKNNDWDKEYQDKSEELEIKVIHWCFKMSAMEYGISIGNIVKNDNKNDNKDKKSDSRRLMWNESTKGEDIIKDVGGNVLKKIFDGDNDYLKKISEIENVKSGDYSEFKLEEFYIWHDLRYENKSNEYKFIYENIQDTNEIKSIKIFNINKEDSKKMAQYWNFLVNLKEKDDNYSETEVVKFLLQKYHTYWENGYLETDTIEYLHACNFSNNDNYNEVKIQSDNCKFEDSYDFFSSCYLNENIKEKCKISKWIDYVYIIKLEEMLDAEKYDKVKVWEMIELDNQKLFEDDDKKIANNKFCGNYYLWNYLNSYKDGEINVKFDVDDKFNEENIYNEIINRVDYENDADNSLLKICLYNNMLDKGKKCNIDIRFNNQRIEKYVCDYYIELLNKRDYKSMNYIKDKYLCFENGEGYDIYEYNNDNQVWIKTDKIEVGCLIINVNQIGDGVKKDLYENNDKNNLICYQWCMNPDIFVNNKNGIDEVKKALEKWQINISGFEEKYNMLLNNLSI